MKKNKKKHIVRLENKNRYKSSPTKDNISLEIKEDTNKDKLFTFVEKLVKDHLKLKVKFTAMFLLCLCCIIINVVGLYSVDEGNLFKNKDFREKSPVLFLVFCFKKWEDLFGSVNLNRWTIIKLILLETLFPIICCAIAFILLKTVASCLGYFFDWRQSQRKSWDNISLSMLGLIYIVYLSINYSAMQIMSLITLCVYLTCYIYVIMRCYILIIKYNVKEKIFTYGENYKVDKYLFFALSFILAFLFLYRETIIYMVFVFNLMLLLLILINYFYDFFILTLIYSTQMLWHTIFIKEGDITKIPDTFFFFFFELMKDNVVYENPYFILLISLFVGGVIIKNFFYENKIKDSVDGLLATTILCIFLIDSSYLHDLFSQKYIAFLFVIKLSTYSTIFGLYMFADIKKSKLDENNYLNIVPFLIITYLLYISVFSFCNTLFINFISAINNIITGINSYLDILHIFFLFFLLSIFSLPILGIYFIFNQIGEDVKNKKIINVKK